MPEVGLAKSAPSEVAQEPIVSQSTAPAVQTQMIWEGVPVEVYRYFGVDVGRAEKRDIDQLKDIYEIAKDGSEGDINRVLDKINGWERKVGAPRITETVYSKIWNYVKLQNHINRLLKQQEIITRTV